MSQTQTLDTSHELAEAPALPEIEHNSCPELSGYDGYLMELETMLQKHDKV